MTVRENDAPLDVQALVGPQLAALADALEAQPPEAGDRPSLCDAWSVRAVLAHMTMADRYDGPAFQRQLEAAGHDFRTVSDTIALRDAKLPMDELLAGLRSETMARWAPPGGGAAGALSHAVIHGLDITTALGLPRTASDEATRAVLDTLPSAGVHRHFGTDVDGRRLRATDLDWSFGDGEEVSAEAGELVLALAGRPRPGLELRP